MKMRLDTKNKVFGTVIIILNRMNLQSPYSQFIECLPSKDFEHPNEPSTAEEVSGEEIPILVQYVVLPDEDLATRQYPLAF